MLRSMTPRLAAQEFPPSFISPFYIRCSQFLVYERHSTTSVGSCVTLSSRFLERLRRRMEYQNGVHEAKLDFIRSHSSRQITRVAADSLDLNVTLITSVGNRVTEYKRPRSKRRSGNQSRYITVLLRCCRSGSVYVSGCQSATREISAYISSFM